MKAPDARARASAVEPGRSLLVRGEAGIGKSALLAEATRRAHQLGMSVFSTSGAPFEAQMPFAGLHRLLRPVTHEINALPKPQVEALSVALGLSDGPAPNIFLIALAALNVIADRAGEAPLLLVIEDAHWLDTASLDVLAFMARRVEMEPIVLLFAARDGPATQLDEAGLAELRLEALDDASANALVDARAPGLTSELRRRVVNEAGGNPLALVELSQALDSKDFGVLSATAPLPITERLERAFAGRVSELPAATCSLLLVAALDEGAPLSEILTAASQIENRPITVDDLAPAEAVGLVTVDDEAVLFRHPLVRAAISQAAALSIRQSAHRELAKTHAADPDRSVWHRAAALTGPDEQVAADLEAAGERALHRGAPAGAAAAFERAAQLSDPAFSRGRLLVRAVETEFELGRSDLALQHIVEAKAHKLGQEERTRLTFLIEASNEDSWSGAARVAAFAEMANEMTSTTGPALALKSLLTVAVASWWGNPVQETRDLIVAAVERLQVAEDDPARLAVLASADPVKRGASVIDRISPMTPDATGDPAALHLVGSAATAVWAFDISLGFLTSAVDGLRAQAAWACLPRRSCPSRGRPSISPRRHSRCRRPAKPPGSRARPANRGGRWPQISPERPWRASAVTSIPHAPWPIKRKRSCCRSVRTGCSRWSSSHAAAAPSPIKRYSDGFDHLKRILDPSDVAYHPFVGGWALSDLVEAAAFSGNLDEARLYLQQLESLAAQTSAPFLRATLSYARPLLSSDDEAEDLYQAAIGTGLSNWPCYRGRLLLNYGRWLRRRRRLADSRVPLRAARENFDALAFGGLAEAARQELRASGETSMRRTPDARDYLTPQELQIAQLAASGLSNREIGQQLYLSPRTVGSHLYRIFPKVGISSRSELAGVLSAATPSAC